MSRRVSLPAADDLFRPTTTAPDQEGEPGRSSESTPQERPANGAARTARASRKPSGRIRHDEKMTVYITSDELLDLEHARLALRRSEGMAVDRGRLVRSAIAIALADFEQNGEDSALVQRLRDQ